MPSVPFRKTPNTKKANQICSGHPHTDQQINTEDLTCLRGPATNLFGIYTQLKRKISPPPDCLKEVGIARIIVVSEFTIIQTETRLPQLQNDMHLTHTHRKRGVFFNMDAVIRSLQVRIS